MSENPLIILVEDTSDNLDLYTLILRRGGFNVTGFLNAKEALQFLEVDAKPSLILCDLMMPGLDGDQFISILRRDERWSQIRVVIMSAVNDLQKRAREMGADGYLRKPFDVAQLEGTVRNHLEALRKN